MENVLITGTSSGIGRNTAELFLSKGKYHVYGLDIKPAVIEDPNYTHIICDVGKQEQLPELPNINYLINNAGTIYEKDAIESNLMGYIYVAEKYAFNPDIKSVLNIGSISGTDGLDTPIYAASQGGRISYTKNLMLRLSKTKHVPVNILCFGAVMTGLEPKLYAQQDLVDAVANESVLKKWIMPDEAAEWVYFMSVLNKSMCGQVLLVDNGESVNRNFIDARNNE